MNPVFDTTRTDTQTDHVGRLMDAMEATQDATARAAKDTMLTPRFYTTDFKAMDAIDVSPVRAEWDKLMAEYESDNNQDHFKRDAAFAEEFKVLMPQLSPELRQEFQDFLISSCTSEFSGCILYNEIRKKVNNPDIKQLMAYMARDESRHAGFINQALKDFDLGINLGALRKNKTYTYFKPKYIFYATYLSEKIGYARYITIYRQLARQPERRFHPIFNWFERWCEDEFRHGEAFALLMRSDPALLRGANRLWIRFFLLAVYATMYVRDHARPVFHAALGVNPTEYDYEVFRICSAISQQVFPLTLDIDDPRFRAGLERIRLLSNGIDAAKVEGGIVGKLKQAARSVAVVAVFARLYCLRPQSNALPAQVRLAPAW